MSQNFRLSGLSMCISKRIKWILKKSHCENFFYIFFQSTHQVDMKNGVEFYKDFLVIQYSKNQLWRKIHHLWQQYKGMGFNGYDYWKSIKIQTGVNCVLHASSCVILFIARYCYMRWHNKYHYFFTHIPHLK